jgi:hypothetical protein
VRAARRFSAFNFSPCCALPPASPCSHKESSTGLSEELPKSGDVPKSPLLPNWQHDAIGRHENILKIDLGAYRGCRRVRQPLD